MHILQRSWCDFVVWAPNDAIHVERIFYDFSFVNDAISKARTFYFDKFLPSIVQHVIIADSCEASRSAVLITEIVVNAQSCDSIEICDNVKMVDKSKASDDTEVKIVENPENCDVEILSVTTVGKLPSHINVMQKLQCRKHAVSGDGNCLYYAVAHQAGFVEHFSHGGLQLRMLALTTMQKHPGVRLEDGLSQHQWEQKKLSILKSSEWGGDLEIRLLAIAIGRDIVVITGTEDEFTYAWKFLCHPPPVPKMRGIFIPVHITELISQWNQYHPSPLLIIYNGINHYDSTTFCKEITI